MKQKSNNIKNKPDVYVRKVTWIGFFINLLLSALKLAAGILGRSQAVLADAIHSLSDGVTDIVVIIGSRYWSNPPDHNHQYGHRRLETVVTIIIGMVLLTAGIQIGWDSIKTIHNPDSAPPEWVAAFAAGVSIITKELLYRWTAFAGKQARSSALIANAWHHRMDAISSIPALLAVAGAIIFPEWSFLDHAGALIVSVLIMQAAVKIMWPGIREIMDFSAPGEICKKIESICLEHKDVQAVHDIRTRYTGMSIQLDLHIVVKGSMTVYKGHNISEAVKKRVLAENLDIVDILIHVDPAPLNKKILKKNPPKKL